MNSIDLGNGVFAIVDVDDYDRLRRFKWFLGTRKYAVCNSGGKQHFMHRMVNNTPKGYFTDHINGNILDNRRYNLRTVTPKQNSMNMASHKGSTSKFKCVNWDKRTRKWKVGFMSNGKHIHGGYFRDECDAALAYNFMIANEHGQYARLNRAEA